jgi:sialic acid synthase SpsE
MSLAKELIYQAVSGGADIVKFQLYDSEKLYGEKQSTELSECQAYQLFDYATKSLKIGCIFSVFDLERVNWCQEMGVHMLKIAYSRQTDTELISACRKVVGDKLFISVNLQNPITDATKLYCVPNYPTRITELKFGDVPFGTEIMGFSDHAIGLEAAKLAIARGAIWIEKHFCWDHSIGVDAPWSMDLNQLKELKDYERFVDIATISHNRWEN